MIPTGKKNIAVLYGGRSVEHEISIISALQMMKVIDITKYKVIPLYIAHSGQWFTGKKLFDKNCYKNFEKEKHFLKEVFFLPVPDKAGLYEKKPSLLNRIKNIFGCETEKTNIDVFLLSFHGEYGEDGCVQGLLELADAAYTSCDVISSALAMNKYLCKSVLREHGIKSLPATVVKKRAAISDIDQVTNQVISTTGLTSFPLFVKPNHLGSSIGISKAADSASLQAALAKVFLRDSEAIIEPCLDDMFEINVSVLDDGKPIASVVEVPAPTGGMLSYEDKYMQDGGKKKGAQNQESQGMAGLTRAIDPKDLDPSIKTQVITSALKAYEVLNCGGVVRFDFMHDNKSGEIYFNELNPQPGSLSFYLWMKSDPPLLYTEELTKIIKAAETRRQEKASREKDLGFKAFK